MDQRQFEVSHSIVVPGSRDIRMKFLRGKGAWDDQNQKTNYAY